MAMASPLGLLPEQVWDSDPIPERGLAPGKPSGSAMPLVWAHSEFIKLCYSRALGHPVDRPAPPGSAIRGKRPEDRLRHLGPQRTSAAIEGRQDAHHRAQGAGAGALGHQWLEECPRTSTRATPGSGSMSPTCRSTTLQPGESIQFTFLWHDSGAWEGTNYEVLITD